MRSNLKRAGHVERMEGEWLAKRVYVRVEGRRRPKLTWEYCVQGCI